MRKLCRMKIMGILKEASEEEEVNPIAQNVGDYVETISGLQVSLSLSMFIIQSAHKEFHGRFDQFVTDHCAIEKEEAGDRTIIVPIEHNTGFRIRESRLKQIHIASSAVPRSNS